MIKGKCKYCGKIIEGFTKKQLEHLMSQHLVSIHRDKVEIKERKEELK